MFRRNIKALRNMSKMSVQGDGDIQQWCNKYESSLPTFVSVGLLYDTNFLFASTLNRKTCLNLHGCCYQLAQNSFPECCSVSKNAYQSIFVKCVIDACLL